jgi:CheY-like chemotaxis protein
MTDLKRILLVEDKSQDVELTLAAFAESNLANQVDVTRDGVEALDYLYCRGKFSDRDGGNPAVVLLDNKMPRLTGLEVLRRLRSDPGFRNLPVVMLTSSREEPDLAESYSLGVNAYIVKPVVFERFIEAIKQIGVFWAVLNEPPPSRKEAT